MDGPRVAELSVLVHEMVHHMQNLSATWYEGFGLERIACEAQEEFLKLLGPILNASSMSTVLHSLCAAHARIAAAARPLLLQWVRVGRRNASAASPLHPPEQ